MEQFHFKGFNPTPHIRAKCERLFSKLLVNAPSDATLSGVLEWDGQLFQCTVEVGSRIYPVALSTNHRNADIALDKAERTLIKKLTQQGAGLGTGKDRPLIVSSRAAAQANLR